MKKIIIVLFLLVGFVQAQNEVDYYGANKSTYSDSLLIADADSVTGEYRIWDKIFYIQVDSNWTASNLAIEIYNEYEDAWELIQDEDGTLLEVTITQGKSTRMKQVDFAGAKKVRFKKITSGSTVAQSGAASTLIIHSLRY